MSRTVGSASKSLKSLIDGILDLSRIEAGHMPVHAVDFNLGGLLADVRGLVTAQGAGEGPAAQYPYHGRERRSDCARDQHHLYEILLNLAGNAVKFTDSGSVTFACRRAAAGG